MVMRIMKLREKCLYTKFVLLPKSMAVQKLKEVSERAVKEM